jgi:hypothetical protein
VAIPADDEIDELEETLITTINLIGQLKYIKWDEMLE